MIGDITTAGKVAPRTGAWIETAYNRDGEYSPSSLPARERGLKQVLYQKATPQISVAPRTGAWIETIK